MIQAIRTLNRESSLEIMSIESMMRGNFENYGEDYVNTLHFASCVFRIKRMRIMMQLTDLVIRLHRRLWR